ncbi:MAG: hypothetical protein ABI411_05430 [Tahibacter sp.]
MPMLIQAWWPASTLATSVGMGWYGKNIAMIAAIVFPKILEHRSLSIYRHD